MALAIDGNGFLGYRKWLVLGAFFTLFMGTISALTPSSKAIAVMVIAPAIINSEPIQKDSPEIYQMAKDALKETLAPKKP